MGSQASRPPTRHLVALLFAALFAPSTPFALADTGTSLGDRTGEGSTPFTGLAQAPEANLFTGSLSTSIPIEIPPGRKNITPQLALQYSSSAGPSPFGYGWDLPLGRIERSTKWGVPRCNGPHSDDFVLSLPGVAAELVNDPPGSNYYRPRIERSYVRAEKFSGQNKWIVEDVSGLRYTFGEDQDPLGNAARIGNDTSTFMQQDPDGFCRFTTAWMLTRVEDPDGNFMQIVYSNISNVAYPFLIGYGGNTNTGTGHFHYVWFDYDEREVEDHIESHRNGAEAILTRQLRRIRVQSWVPNDATPVRTYTFTYNDDDPEWEADGYQSILTAVEVTGKPTQHFVYSSSVPSAGGLKTAEDLTQPTFAYSSLRATNQDQEVYQTLLDMNGDGLVDLVRSDQHSGSRWDVSFGYADGDDFGFDPTPTQWELALSNTKIRNTSTTDCTGTCVTRDTFDLTGDGVPDYVRTSDQVGLDHWEVYPGRSSEQDGWGFDPAIPWPVPSTAEDPNKGKYIRRDLNRNTYKDTLDMNGDGLPDLVISAQAQSPPYEWDVYLNTGAGFEMAPLPHFPAPAEQLSNFGASQGGPAAKKSTLADFNGDGLPDFLNVPDFNDPRCHPDDPLVLVSCLEVYLNTGQGFPNSPTLLIPIPSSNGIQYDQGAVENDIVDINGDGLPDYVMQDINDQWRVLLNLGGTLEALVYIPSQILPGSNWTDGIPPRVWEGGSGPIRETDEETGRTTTDMVDLNGDGLPDRVMWDTPLWQVQLNGNDIRPNLLAVMDNGFGGTNTIVYQPSTLYDNTLSGDDAPDLPFVTWVVAATRLTDGLCEDPDATDLYDPTENECIGKGHEIVTTFNYSGGLFDGSEREFRGFRNVYQTRVEALEDGIPIEGNVTLTQFHQDAERKGLIERVQEFAGSSTVVRLLVNNWETVTITVAPEKERMRLYQALDLTVVMDLGGLSGATLVLRGNSPPDSYGNVTHSYTQSTFYSSDPIDDHRTDTYTEYAIPVSPATPIYNRPSHVWTEEYDPATVLEEKWFYYDDRTDTSVDRGRLTRVVNWLNTDPANSPVTLMEYDDFGNIERVEDANHGVTTTTYEGGRGLYPRTVTSPLGHATVTETDYRWGQPISVTDPNGAITRYSYDEAGRRKCLALPGDTLGNCSVDYQYAFASQTGEYSSITMQEKQTGHPDLTTVQYFDALGRPRHTDAYRVVEGVGQMVRTNAVDYDARGRVSARYHAYPASETTPTNGATTFDYHLNGSSYIDPLGRVHKTIYSDETFRRTEYAHGLTTSYDEELNKTETQADALGRVLVKRTYISGAEYSSTHYTYDGLGRLLTTRQNDDLNPLMSTTYDSLGRKTQTVDRDSGTWEYHYDGNGNLIMQEDPEPDQHIQFCYDAANRPTRRCLLDVNYLFQGPCHLPCSSNEVLYEYDDASVSNAKGRLTRVQDDSGETLIQQYDARGRVRIVEKRIEAEGVTTSATSCYEYDARDRVRAIWYPDGEIVYTDHDASGQPVKLRSSSGTEYINDVQYDIFGRIKLIDRGNKTFDRREYYDQLERHRLLGVKTTKEEPGQPVVTHLDLLYTSYTPRGLLEQVTDIRNPSGNLSITAGYLYDFLGRLFIAGMESEPSYLRLYDYDNLGNVRRVGDTFLHYDDPQKPHQVTRIGSTLVEHDANGNRTSKEASTQVYEYAEDDRLARVYTPGETVRFVYDHAGQLAVKVVEPAVGTPLVTRYYAPEVETTGDGYTMKWYMLGGLRVASQRTTTLGWEMAALGESPVRVAYASSGQPVLIVLLQRNVQTAAGMLGFLFAAGLLAAPWRKRRGLGLVVRHGHVVGMTLVFTLGTLPWPIAFQPAPASAACEGCDCPTPVPPPSGTFRHYHFDHLGSTVAVTTGFGSLAEQIRYYPYGEIRGRWSGSGIPFPSVDPSHRREFTGYETELYSGLQYAGARFYDPEMGSFLTHDPAHEFMSPYNYVGWDPVNGTDPTGECLFWCGVLVAALIGALANGIQAAINGASVGEAFEAAAVGGAVGAVTGAGLGVVGAAVNRIGYTAVTVAYRAALVGSGGYGAYQGYSSGNSVLGTVSAVTAAFGVIEALSQGGNPGTPGQTSSGDAASATYAEANAAGVSEVQTAENTIGYRPAQHGWKLLHAGRAYHWTLKTTEFLFGTSSGPLGYLGRILVTPFVTAGGILYELHASFNPFFNGQFPLDKQNPFNLIFDTAGDLVANTYGQAVALTPGLSPASASTALQAVRYIPGPHSEIGLYRLSRPGLGY